MGREEGDEDAIAEETLEILLQDDAVCDEVIAALKPDVSSLCTEERGWPTAAFVKCKCSGGCIAALTRKEPGRDAIDRLVRSLREAAERAPLPPRPDDVDGTWIQPFANVTHTQLDAFLEGRRERAAAAAAAAGPSLKDAQLAPALALETTHGCCRSVSLAFSVNRVPSSSAGSGSAAPPPARRARTAPGWDVRREAAPALAAGRGAGAAVLLQARLHAAGHDRIRRAPAPIGDRPSLSASASDHEDFFLSLPLGPVGRAARRGGGLRESRLACPQAQRRGCAGEDPARPSTVASRARAREARAPQPRDRRRTSIYGSQLYIHKLYRGVQPPLGSLP